MAYLGQIPTIPTPVIDAPTTTVVQNSSLMLLGSVSGTNTITATTSPAITSYLDGQTFRFESVGANTGAVTINISGLGAKAITKSGASPLVAGDIAAGAMVQITYDGTQFQMVSGAGGSGGGAVANGTLYEAGTLITDDYTLSAGKNALAVKTLSVETGNTLTIPNGQSLVVLGAGGQSGTPDAYVNTSGNQTIGGVKNFTSAPTLNGADLTSIGVGQTWQNVTGSRAMGVTYTNTTGRPISVAFRGSVSNAAGVVLCTINGEAVPFISVYCEGAFVMAAGAIVIPTGATYKITQSTSGSVSLSTWHELW